MKVRASWGVWLVVVACSSSGGPLPLTDAAADNRALPYPEEQCPSTWLPDRRCAIAADCFLRIDKLCRSTLNETLTRLESLCVPQQPGAKLPEVGRCPGQVVVSSGSFAGSTTCWFDADTGAFVGGAYNADSQVWCKDTSGGGVSIISTEPASTCVVSERTPCNALSRDGGSAND